MSTNKKFRLENKKRKLAAHLNVALLNEDDKKEHIAKGENTEPRKRKYEYVENNSNEPIVAVIKESGNKRGWLPPESQDLEELRKRLRERKKKCDVTPHLRLKSLVGEPAVYKPGEQVVPIFLSDVQDLLTFYLTANPFYTPRWCKVDKISRVTNMVLFVIENISSKMYNDAKEELPTLMASDAILEVLLPSSYGGHIVEELAHVPISPASRRKLLEQHVSIDGVLQNYKHLRYKMLRAMFPIKSAEKMDESLPSGDRFPRTDLLLDVQQLLDEKYPMPYGALKDKYGEFVFSKEEYGEVSNHSPLFAVDCEMCVTGNGMELTRVSIVDESLTLVYDTLVKPDLPITDYLTRFSGVTAKQMKDVTTRLCDVQKAIRELLPADAILVGQSLNCDLTALKMMHPYVIDTSVIFNISGSRDRKSKLATLAREFLGERIQDGSGHCSVEDSSTCIKLVKVKLNNSSEFGDAVQVGRAEAAVHQATAVATAAGAPIATIPTCPQITQALVHCAIESNKSMCIVGSKEVVRGYVGNFRDNKLVTFKEVTSTSKTIEAAASAIPSHGTTLVHLAGPDNVNQIEEWIASLWQVLPTSGMLTVLLGGQSPKASGLYFVRINKS